MIGNNRPGTRPTLQSTLRRIHLSVALIAICTAGLSLTVLGITALRVYADHNLRLVARSVAYALEAPVVFNDKAATRDALALIASEDVAYASVYDRGDHLLAEWRRPDAHRFSGLSRAIGELLLAEPVEQPILHDAQPVGYLRLSGDPANLLSFLASGAFGLLACLLLTAVSAHYMSRRMLTHITEPVRNLMRVAHAVRSDRAFEQRTPPAHIAELHALGEDFNGLLDELEDWQKQLQHENRSLAHQASHDALTGLLNRTAFEQALERTLRAVQAQGRHAAVLYLDNDAFKDINDRFGHAAGDEVLISVAARVRACLRETDLVARLGGDEFAVLLAPLQRPQDAIRVVEHILSSLREPIMLKSGTSVTAPVSIGIATYPAHGGTAEALLRAADGAMYGAKRRSGGTWQSAPPPDGAD
ncbi:diguanylate cyclase domain-containing protein [Cupriavidus malaysiensis]|uniref:Diguanylate cyclase n=1 Tax=Cupriavidus malaysiensis TaxID=367825 RepID=A0ABN4TIM3_9BURK|nr:diguanylate cyclase [Cupriavidus malaysiensis]AOZ07042.1 diguanylate cyclase [Cupriavidus malaysiensis]